MADTDVADWRKKLKIPAIVVCVLLVLYAVLGLWGLPYLIKSKLPELVKEHLNREGSIQNVSINPFLFKVSLKGLEIKETTGNKFVAFDELFVDFETSSIFKSAVMFDAIRLTGLFVEVDVLKNGKLNFDDLIHPGGEKEEPKPGKEDEGPFPVLISKLDIQQGVVVFKDLSLKTPFRTSIEPIDLSIENFSTYLDSDSGYQLSAEFADAGKIDWKGHVNITPLHSNGRIQLAGFRPVLIWKYIQDQVKFKFIDGTYELDARYKLELADGELQLKVINGNFKLKNFKLSEKGEDKAIIDIPSVAIDDIDVNLAKQLVTINSVSSQNAKIETWVTENGDLNYQELFFASKNSDAVKLASSSAGSDDSGSKPWLFKIQHIVLKDYGVNFQDRSLATPLTLNFSPLTLTLDNFSSDLNGKLPLTVTSAVNESGYLKVAGALGLNPIATDVDLDIKLNLPDFQPYIDTVTQLEFGSGEANVKGSVDFKLDQQSNPQLAFNGAASIDKFVGQDKIEKNKLFDWNALRFDGVDFNLDPLVVNIKDVSADQAFARFIINPDGSTNISKVFATAPQPGDGEQETESEADGEDADAVIKIDTVMIKNMSAMFADNSLKPNFATGLTRLNGTVKGLSTDKKSRASVNLKGRADKTAPLRINGKMNVFNPDGYTDIAMNFKNLNLTTLTPYSGKFVGRKIEKGKMSVDLKYKLNRRKLKADNKIVLDQLTLGDEVDSPDAVSLPLSLAIALLRDANSVIKIDLPLKGSLDDPEFSIWGLVGDVLLNLMTKIVTSPFAALGNLVEGGEAMGSVAFIAGQAKLSEDQKAKLGQIIEALSQRPALRLEIEGIAGAGDIRVAAEQQFRDGIIASKKAELQKAAEDGDQPIAEISLSDEDFHRYLLQAYYQKITGMQHLSVDSPMIDQQLNSETVIKTARETILGDIKVDVVEMRKLAQDRAKNIHGYLIEQKLNADRIFLLDVDVELNAGPDADLNTVISRLSLTAD